MFSHTDPATVDNNKSCQGDSSNSCNCGNNENVNHNTNTDIWMPISNVISPLFIPSHREATIKKTTIKKSAVIAPELTQFCYYAVGASTQFEGGNGFFRCYRSDFKNDDGSENDDAKYAWDHEITTPFLLGWRAMSLGDSISEAVKMGLQIIPIGNQFWTNPLTGQSIGANDTLAYYFPNFDQSQEIAEAYGKLLLSNYRVDAGSGKIEKVNQTSDLPDINFPTFPPNSGPHTSIKNLKFSLVKCENLQTAKIQAPGMQQLFPDGSRTGLNAFGQGMYFPCWSTREGPVGSNVNCGEGPSHGRYTEVSSDVNNASSNVNSSSSNTESTEERQPLFKGSSSNVNSDSSTEEGHSSTEGGDLFKKWIQLADASWADRYSECPPENIEVLEQQLRAGFGAEIPSFRGILFGEWTYVN